MRLLRNITANGNIPLGVRSGRKDGREIHVWANAGTYDSASIQFEWSINGTDWIAAGTAITGTGYQTFSVPPGVDLRLAVTAIVTAADVDLYWDIL